MPLGIVFIAVAIVLMMHNLLKGGDPPLNTYGF